MEVRVTFVVGGVEVVIVTDKTEGLSELIKDVSSRVKTAVESEVIVRPEPRVEVTKPTILAGTVPDRIKYLANQVGADEDSIRHVVHFGDDYPVLIKPAGGDNRAEQQRRALLMLGTVLDLVYEKPEVGTQLYADILRRSNVPEQRLDIAWSDLKGKFILKGQGRGARYEITVPGRTEGLSLLRELAGVTT